MTLPASGAISSAQIRAEIGGSGPVTVPSTEVRTLTGVASGPIVVPDDFWGKSGGGGSDQTPAAVNWGDAVGTDTAENSNQNITDINVPILIRATISSAVGAAPAHALNLLVDGSQEASCSITNGQYAEAYVTTGQAVRFQGVIVFGTTGQTRSCTVTVTNVTDGGATLDTFVVNLTQS